MQVLQAAGFLLLLTCTKLSMGLILHFTHFVDIINTPATFYLPTFFFSNTHIALLHHHQTEKCLGTEMYFARMRLPPHPAAYWIQPPRHLAAPWAYQNVTWWLNRPKTKTKNPSISRSRWGYKTISEVRRQGLGLTKKWEENRNLDRTIPKHYTNNDIKVQRILVPH